MKNLLHERCTPRTGAPMTDAEVHDHLAQLSSWKADGGAIEKRFDFKNFHETMAFVNALAWIAHTEDHHPDLQVSYNRCTVRFSTHSVGGISVNDMICAARTDALVSFVG